MIDHSVTRLIEALRAGDEQAAAEIWRLYWPRVVALARVKMGEAPRRVADEEDIALSAMKSWWRLAEQPEAVDAEDADGLWRLLATITSRKAINQRKHQARLKRGGGGVLDESALDSPDASGGGGLANLPGDAATPERLSHAAERIENLMERLEDPVDRVIALWRLEGRTNEEMARGLDCSLSAVERRLRRIRERLRRWADEDAAGGASSA